MTDETTGGGGRRGKDLADEMLDSAHRVWLAGLGALARAEEEGSRLFSQLVERGRESEAAGRGRVDETVRGAADTVRGTADTVRSAVGSVSAGIEAQVGEVMRRMGVPTREEIQQLTRRVEELAARIDRMGGTDAAGAAPKPPKPPKPPKAPKTSGGAKS